MALLLLVDMFADEAYNKIVYKKTKRRGKLCCTNKISILTIIIATGEAP